LKADDVGESRKKEKGEQKTIGVGVDLPLPLIFSGVIGGLIAFGIIGLFIGPAFPSNPTPGLWPPVTEG
jgi:hypothetical protein